MTTERRYRKLTINIAPAMYDELKRLADDGDMTMTELFRRAIALYRFVQEHESADFLVEEDGTTHRIKFL